MSTTYLLYTEIKLDGEWVCVCPYVKYNGKERLVTTYESGSRSYFGATYDKMRELDVGIKFPEGLSQVLKEKFYDNVIAKKQDDGYEEYDPENTLDYYRHVIVCVPLHALQSALPSAPGLKYQYHGIFHKNDVYRYESGDTEYIEPISHKEYAALDKKEKEAYVYYEYDDNMEWPYYVKQIIRLAQNDIMRYIDATAKWGKEYEARIIAFAL